eukprot:COSAG01_NODE_1691_length_9480_cov_5.430231_5_plen_198_part_00
MFEGLRSPPESIELRCLHQELGRGVLIGIGTLELSGLGGGGGGDPAQQPRPDGTSPWELEASSVELRDDWGKPAGSIEVRLAWLPRRKARKQVGGGRPSQLTVGVIRGEDIRSPWGSRYAPSKGRYDDPYCVVRVGTVRERSHRCWTVRKRACPTYKKRPTPVFCCCSDNAAHVHDEPACGAEGGAEGLARSDDCGS